MEPFQLNPDRPDASDEDSEEEQPARPEARPGARRIGLDDFLRMIVAGGGAELRAAANSNEELVQHLWRGGTIRSPAVRRALLACRRDMFMPENYVEEAFIDAPVRVEELGFNISAPHIHATALESLELQEGDKFIDVGCGCGLLSAAAAQLVGTAGQVMAIDIRQSCLDLSQRAVTRLREDDQDYAESACAIQWDLHNVFIPSPRHVGKYSKVYVGAACPRDRLRDVLKLLRPEGGLLMVPVDSELLLLKKLPEGKVVRRSLSAVRFSELEVPRDVEVVLACMKEELDRARHIEVPPSTYEGDLAAIASGNGNGSMPTSPASAPAGASPAHQARAGDGSIRGLEPYGAAGVGVGGHGAGQRSLSSPGQDMRPPELLGTPKRHKPDTGLARQPSYLQQLPDPLAYLGPPDCYLHGVDESQPSSCSSSGQAEGLEGQEEAGAGGSVGLIWRLPAHRAVLQARCEHFRARFLSGMRDAQEGALAAPEGVSEAAVQALLHYVYTDAVVQLPLEQVTEVLHVAVFYGCPRLISLCEQRLAAVLTTPEEGAEEAAAQLLALAEEVGGLSQLRTLALTYVVENYTAVSRSESYKQLPRSLVDVIAAEACAHANRMLATLKGLANHKGSSKAATPLAPRGALIVDDDDDDNDML